GGGHDNISVVLADFDGEGLGDPTEARALYQQYPLPPDEDRARSMPPRETTMKSGGPKPGADVKHGDSPRDVVVEPVPSSSRAWSWVRLVLWAGGGGAGGAYWWSVLRPAQQAGTPARHLPTPPPVDPNQQQLEPHPPPDVPPQVDPTRPPPDVPPAQPV